MPKDNNTKSKEITRLRQDKYERAFQYYKSLGEKRSLTQVAKTFHVDRMTVRTWSVKNHWQAKLEKELEIETNKFRKQIEKTQRIRVDSIGLIIEATCGALHSLIRTNGDGKTYLDLEIKSAKSFGNVVDALDRLVKLEQLLQGSPTQRTELNLPLAQMFRNIADIVPVAPPVAIPEKSIQPTVDADFTVENEEQPDIGEVSENKTEDKSEKSDEPIDLSAIQDLIRSPETNQN